MNYSYKIHIINRDLNLDPTYKNVVQVFNPLTNTKDYSSVFTNAELTFDATDTEINFDIDDGINASVVLDIQPSDNLEEEQANINKQFGVNSNSVSMQEAINRQYAIVQEQTSDNNGNITNTKLYFYFIDKASIRNSFSVKYNLILDVFMTYPLFSDISVDKTKISRAHVNRFTNESTLNNATLNLNLKYIETGEPLDTEFTKICSKVSQHNFINFCGTTYKKLSSTALTDDAIENIINNLSWLYVLRRQEGGGYDNEIYVAPYTNNNEYYSVSIFQSQDDNPSNYNQLYAGFLYDELAEDPYVYNAFISPLSPFGTLNQNYNDYYVAYDFNPINRTVKIIFVNGGAKTKNIQDFTENPEIATEYHLSYDSAKYALKQTYPDTLRTYVSYFETENITLFNKSFTDLNNTPFDYNVIEKAEIKSKMKQSFNEYTLKTLLDTSTTKLDLTLMKTNEIKLKVMNNFSNQTNGEIYFTANDIYKKDFGIFTKAQYMPLFYSDKFKEYKATNKNYAITGQAIPIISGTLGGAVGGALKGGIYGAIIGGIVGFGTSAYKVYSNFDNMQNSPDSIKLKGQNINIDNKVKNRFFYFENNTLRETDKKAVNMYFYEYGYTINEIEDISNFFNRSSFNYIQLENCKKDLHALINENIIDIVVKALEEGVRFWKPSHYASNKFNYTTNNLEESLLL